MEARHDILRARRDLTHSAMAEEALHFVEADNERSANQHEDEGGRKLAVAARRDAEAREPRLLQNRLLTFRKDCTARLHCQRIHLHAERRIELQNVAEARN